MQLCIPLLSTIYLIKESSRTTENYDELLKDLPILNKVNYVSECIIDKTKEDQFFQVPLKKYEQFYQVCTERDLLICKASLFSLARSITGIALCILFPGPIGFVGLAMAVEGLGQLVTLGCSERTRWHASENRKSIVIFDYDSTMRINFNLPK